jgi:hypothetical protein
MLRRCSIPITILSLVAGSMLAAGSASAAQLTHVAARHTSHASSGHRPGFGVPNFQPGGPMDRYGSGSSPGRRGSSASSSTSTNWSGYAVTGSKGTFTSVSASWTEPSATCSSSGGGGHGRGGGGSSDQYAAFWVGLDGYANDTVEQTGTDSDCDGSTPEYYGWYEMYPAGPVYYNTSTYPVEAGDSMSGSVTYSGSTYTLTLTDNTRGWSIPTLVSGSSQARASAEVITEAPSSNSGVLPLADFGTINYTAATEDGSSMGGVSPIQITMVDSRGEDKDSTSSISASGAFSNTWLRSS